MTFPTRLLVLTILLSSFFIFNTVSAVVLISQIQTAGVSTTDEFIELYNFSSSSVSLENWSLKKMTAGGTVSNIVSAFPATALLNPFSYYLIGHRDYLPVNSTVVDTNYSNNTTILADNNSALLYNNGEVPQLVDRVDWGNVTPPTGQPSSNPNANESLIRLPNDATGNYIDTDNSNADFIILPSAPRNSTSPSRPTYTPPIDIPSSTTTENTPTTTTTTTDQTDLWPFIKLNEIFPNPTSGNEWVELYNTTSTAITLTGGSLCDNRTTSDCTIVSLSGTIAPLSWLLIPLSSSRLNNDGDSVLLKNPDDTIIDQVIYTAIAKDQAVARVTDGIDTDNTADWEITTNPTPDALNNIVHPVVALPTVSSGGGGGSSYSPSTNGATAKTATDKKIAEPKDTTTIAWHLNVPKLTVINSSTIFSVLGSADPRGGELFVTWNFGSSTATGATVEHTFASSGIYHITVTGTSTASTTGKTTFTLTVKNPLNNPDAAVRFISLSPRQTDDIPEHLTLGNNSSSTIDISRWKIETENGKIFTLPPKSFIPPYSTLTFYSTATHLTLPDTGGTIILRLPDDTLVDMVTYDKSKSGATYVLGPNGWLWRPPSATELLPVVLGEKIKASGTTTKTSRYAGAVTIAEARSLPIQTNVTITGVVTLVPGILGKTYGYIEDETGGMRIYSYSGDFPSLHLGNRIRVSGVLSTANKITRLRITNRVAITLLNSTTSTPITATISDLGDNDLGRLVTITGEVTKLLASTLYLDDGEAEALVSLSTKVKFDRVALRIGKHIAITGIIDGGVDSWRLYPRSNNDITAAPNTLTTISTTAPTSTSRILNPYTATTGGGISLVGLALYLKRRKKKPVLPPV
jgi:hypothetical protein